MCQRDIGANWKSSQWPKLEQLKQQNKEVFNYNLKDKINIHESIVLQINDWINE